MSYDPANRLLTGVQGADVTTFTHSPEGNLTGEHLGSGITTYVFDDENRVIRVIRPDATRSTYTHSGGFPVDVEGLRRTAQEPGGPVTTFIWDGTDYIGEY